MYDGPSERSSNAIFPDSVKKLEFKPVNRFVNLQVGYFCIYLVKQK